MRQLLLFLLPLVLMLSAVAAQNISQATIKIVAVPANTLPQDKLYAASNLNRWNPKDPTFQFVRSGNNYVLSLTRPVGTTMLYKITKGSWDYVEKSKDQYEIDNRCLQFTRNNQTVIIKVANWRTPHKQPRKFTISGDIYLQKDFKMPQLGRQRNLRIYLPPDYHSSARRYPVLYFQDGQNIFDDATSFVGEWQVDETLERLFRQGKTTGVIVVAIDHAGEKRYDEYSPWPNPNRGGGQGDCYSRFLVETLKPFIDSNYRTRPTREFTAIAGSDMGAFISLYTAWKYPQVFAKVAAFSPCFWFAKKPLLAFLKGQRQSLPLQIYIDVGSREGINRQQTLMYPRDAQEIVAVLLHQGIARQNIRFVQDFGAGHHEKDWSRRFPDAFLWLFSAQ